LAGPLLFGTRLLLIRGITRRTGPRGISLSASMAWDLSRVETLPFPEGTVTSRNDPGGGPDNGRPLPGTVIPEEFRSPGPLSGIGRNLAITGLGG